MTGTPYENEIEVEAAEEIVKALLVGGGDGSPGESRQILEDPFADLGGEIIEPPANPLVWAAAMERNTRLHRAIHTHARNTVGLGWEIVPVIDVNEDTPQADLDRIEEETAKLEALFLHRNREMPFTTVIYLVKIDEEATGNGYMEVTRNGAGEIDGLYHAPSHTIRILKGGRGFVQIRGNVKRYFKNFGDERAVDATTGQEASGEGLPPERRASELIHFKVYSPRSSFPACAARRPACRAARQRGAGRRGRQARGLRHRPGLLHDRGREPGDGRGLAPDHQRAGRGRASAARSGTPREFEPDRLDKEFRLNHTILHAPPFEAELVEFRFRRPTISDPMDRAKIEDLYARHGALTPNDLRGSLGLDPYPEEFAFASKPLPVALLEMQLALAGGAGEKPASRLLDELLELRKELATRVGHRRRPASCEANAVERVGAGGDNGSLV